MNELHNFKEGIIEGIIMGLEYARTLVQNIPADQALNGIEDYIAIKSTELLDLKKERLAEKINKLGSCI